MKKSLWSSRHLRVFAIHFLDIILDDADVAVEVAIAFLITRSTSISSFKVWLTEDWCMPSLSLRNPGGLGLSPVHANSCDESWQTQERRVA